MTTSKRGGQLLAGLAVSAFCVASQAAEVRPLIKGGFDFGGDTIVTAVFVGGETESIKANEGFYVGGGVSIINEARTIEAEISIAYKASFIRADNGDIDWTRVPVEGLVFYRMPKFRLGGGLTLHLNPKLDGSGVVGGLNIKFDDALGLVLQADYLFTDKLGVGLRYTNIKYEAKGAITGSAKGDGVGITASFRF
jgi:opacity protein-like surface antigen